MHLAILEIRIQREVTHSPHSIGLYSLTREVVGVFDLEIRRDERFRIQLRTDSCRTKKVTKQHILTLGDFCDSDRMRKRSTASPGKKTGCVSRADAGAFGQA